MKKKTTTKTASHETQNLVQTPTNPAYVDAALQGLTGQVSDLSKLDPYSLVAGPDALQTQAGQGAAGLTTSPVYDRLSNAGPQSVVAASGQEGVDGYRNKYLEDVVKSSLGGFDQNADQVRQQQMLDLGGDATFGGSGGSILRSLSEGQFAKERGALDSGLRFGAEDRAFGLAGADADRRQGASLANAGLAEQAYARQLAAANSGGEQGRANIGTQAGIGEMLQQLAQRRAISPLSLLGTQATLFSGLPFGLVHGQNTNGVTDSNSTSKTTVSDPMGTIAGLAAGAGSLATGLGSLGLGFGAAGGGMGFGGAMLSDRRTKTDIKRVGETDDGLAVFTYRYKAGGPPQMGVMAQDVAKKKPEAVRHMGGGLLGVDYGAL